MLARKKAHAATSTTHNRSPDYYTKYRIDRVAQCRTLTLRVARKKSVG